MNLLEGLKNCAVANRMFVDYYKRNGWQLPIQLKDLLSEKYARYQTGIFIDFLAYHNIAIFVTIKGFSLYIADPSLLNDFDKRGEGIIYTDVGNGWLLLETREVKVPQVSPDATLAFVRLRAIISAMELLNTLKRGFNKKVNP